MRVNLLAAVMLLSGTVSLWAAPQPQNSEKLLWAFNPEMYNTNVIGHICMTKKKAPFKPRLCFGENKTASGLKGFMTSKNEKNQIIETFKVQPVGKWIRKYVTTEYVSNTDVYTRSLMITDAKNNSSILTETFSYSNESDFTTEHILTLKVSGNLPDGTLINLDNGYFFHATN